jgi:hypothetical protein
MEYRADNVIGGHKNLAAWSVHKTKGAHLDAFHDMVLAEQNSIGCGFPHTNNHVHMANFHAFGGFRQGQKLYRLGRNIDHPLLVFDVEMVVIGGVSVEIRARGIDRNFAQQARFVELMERIIDGGERNIDARIAGFAVQLFSTDMTMRPAEQQLGKGNTLARGAKASHTQDSRQARFARRRSADALDTISHRVLEG